MRKIETKKLAAAVTALALCAGVLTGCGGAASSTASSTAVVRHLTAWLPAVPPPKARL